MREDKKSKIRAKVAELLEEEEDSQYKKKALECYLIEKKYSNLYMNSEFDAFLDRKIQSLQPTEPLVLE